MICPLMLHLHTRTIIWSVWLRITFVTCAGGRHFTWNVTTACQSCRGNKVSVIDKCVRLSIPHTHWFSSLFVMCCKVAVICNNLPVYHLTFICFCVLPFLHACRVDSPTREVTKAEMRELESSYGVPVLTTANVKHAETSRYLPRGVAPDLLHVSAPRCIMTFMLFKYTYVHTDIIFTQLINLLSYCRCDMSELIVAHIYSLHAYVLTKKIA